MSISTTTSTTTVASCFSPIEYILREAQILSESSDGVISLANAFITIANNGIVVDSCNSCFCGCDYFLGSVEKYNQYYDGTYLGVPSCCVNVFASVETYLNYLQPPTSSQTQPLGVVNPSTAFKVCCNGFNDCVSELINRLFKSDCGYDKTQLLDFLLDLGLVEQLPPGYESQICILIETLDEITNCGCYVDILLYIIENGIRVTCDQDGGVITIFSP